MGGCVWKDRGEGGGVSKFIVIGKWLNYSGIRIAVGGYQVFSPPPNCLESNQKNHKGIF